MNKITILTTTSSFSSPIDSDRFEVVHNPLGRRLSEEDVVSLLENHQPAGIIAGIEPLTERALKASKNLKVISRCGIGLDSVDLKAAELLGIEVLNTPDEPTDAVAELTIALSLSVLRKIPELDHGVREGNWKGQKGFLLKGKTVGIIGCGRIGSRVAFLFKAFGCSPVGYDPYVKEHEIIEMRDLDSIIRDSDILTLHIPLNDNTRNIISRERILEMKSGAVLINTARGGLVDEGALYESLSEGRLAGAGMDCFGVEPYHGKLTELDNVVLTPHMGSSTYETRKKMEEKAVENLIKGLTEAGLI